MINKCPTSNPLLSYANVHVDRQSFAGLLQYWGDAAQHLASQREVQSEIGVVQFYIPKDS